jgi:hypothetical protein
MVNTTERVLEHTLGRFRLTGSCPRFPNIFDEAFSSNEEEITCSINSE